MRQLQSLWAGFEQGKVLFYFWKSVLELGNISPSGPDFLNKRFVVEIAGGKIYNRIQC